jgi:Rrf2 family protein
MRISTRSRYGIRLMIILAVNYNKGYTFLKDIAKEEEISEKYLSQIVILLRRAGLLIASRGIHGGYTLAIPPSEVTAKEIVEVLEGDLALLDCTRDETICTRSNNCASQYLWAALSLKISEFLSSITLKDLVKMKSEKELRLIDYSI